jgi:hypothetical protein
LVTNLDRPIDLVVWFYDQRAGAEDLIQQANNHAGLRAYPLGRFDMNRNHFQLTMLASSLNCWLMLFNREEEATVETLRHTRLVTARLRFLFVAARLWAHAGSTGVSYGDRYPKQGVFQRLMARLRRIAPRRRSFSPVVDGALV